MAGVASIGIGLAHNFGGNAGMGIASYVLPGNEKTEK